MQSTDAEHWNARYQEDVRFETYTHPRRFLVENAHWLPAQGVALDAAMGLGGNAEYLLQRGLRVVGIDISSVAVRGRGDMRAIVNEQPFTNGGGAS